MSEIKRAVFGPLLQLIGRKPKMTVGHELSVFLAFMGRHIDHHERALWLAREGPVDPKLGAERLEWVTCEPGQLLGRCEAGCAGHRARPSPARQLRARGTKGTEPVA